VENRITKINHVNRAVAIQIHSVFQNSYRVEAKLIDADDFPPLKRSVSDIVNSKSSFIVFFEGDALAATAEISMDVEYELSINNLVVDPKHFRKGYASKLLEYVLDNYNRDTAVVETATKNLPAISLYQKFGFAQEKRWRTEQNIHKVKFRLNCSNKKMQPKQ